ncbi:MAG: hypothetical protein AB1716_00260 [Planctomycetota bacterium]
MSTQGEEKAVQQKDPLGEIVQPFIDLAHAPRALWGINLAYVLEGMVYFGMLGYLAIHFSSFVFQGVEHADEWSHSMVMVLTAGITIAMFFLGFIADKRGVRFALVTAFIFMLVGRVFWAGAPNLFGLQPARPGVFAGDKVSLHITQLSTRDGVKAITEAAVVGNDLGADGAVSGLVLDLAEGPGMAPSAELESRCVRLSRATVRSGEELTWEVEYGSAPVTARLFATPAQYLGLCAGAVISVERGYISYWKEKNEWVIRAHWAEDFGPIDTAGCAPDELEKARKAQKEAELDEAALRATTRWPVRQVPETSQVRAVSINELRGLSDGPVNVVLRDAYVTYVRNGGYFLQSEPQGAAIFAFVDPTWSPLHILTLVGMVLVVIGYGMYQPAAYAGVRQFTTPKTAAMGFAMLYALMNLGGWFPTFAFLLRDKDYLGLGIPGVYWVYAGFTAVALLSTVVLLSRTTVQKAIATAKEETARIKAAEQAASGPPTGQSRAPAPDRLSTEADGPKRVKPHMWLFWIGAMAVFLVKGESPWYYTWGEVSRAYATDGLWSMAVIRWILAGLVFILPVVFAANRGARNWLVRHPLSNGKFAFFIFALIPVQTLFTYNWLVLPPYINRAFAGWIGKYFEIAANANPILIFIAVPIITAMTQKAKVYNMMIIGTLVMAAPAFLNALGPHWWALFGYIFIMTIGEAMWQPRFLQYAAEIAPEGRTGQYMGVAQLPWFLTKMLVPLLYSGWMMDRYCPAEGPKNTEMMWLIFGCIAICSTVLLMLAKPWIGRDFKTKAA